MSTRKQNIERLRELAQNDWSAKYMLLMATGFLTDEQLEAVVQSELECRESVDMSELLRQGVRIDELGNVSTE